MTTSLSDFAPPELQQTEQTGAIDEAPICVDDLRPENLTPVGDRYIVQLLKVSNETDTGIWLPEESVNEQSTGFSVARVVAVGGVEHHPFPKRNDEHASQIFGRWGHRLDRDTWVPMFCKVGDLVLVDRYAGRTMVLGGKQYRQVNQVDVLAKLNSTHE